MTGKCHPDRNAMLRDILCRKHYNWIRYDYPVTIQVGGYNSYYKPLLICSHNAIYESPYLYISLVYKKQNKKENGC